MARRPVDGIDHRFDCLPIRLQPNYALFLPSSYDGTTAAPIVYIFDPVARGKVGVSVFEAAAEKYGFILVCSNNARNGSWDLVFDAADALFEDAERRLVLDPNRIYTAGFSGGSRAAMALAVLLKGKIKGSDWMWRWLSTRTELSARLNG